LTWSANSSLMRIFLKSKYLHEHTIIKKSGLPLEVDSRPEWLGSLGWDLYIYIYIISWDIKIWNIYIFYFLGLILVKYFCNLTESRGRVGLGVGSTYIWHVSIAVALALMACLAIAHCLSSYNNSRPFPLQPCWDCLIGLAFIAVSTRCSSVK